MLILLLAQLGRPTATPVPSLPEPPGLEYYFLENPWYAAFGLAVPAIISYLILSRTGRPKAALISGIAGAGLAGVIILIASLVTTERERLQQRTRELVDAAAAADTSTLAAMLDDPITFWAGTTPLQMSKASILDSVSSTLGGAYRLKEHSIGYVQAAIDAGIVARTQVHVRVRTRETIYYDVPIGSWWKIDWRRDGDRPDGAWRITGLTLVQLDLVDSPERVREYLRP